MSLDLDELERLGKAAAEGPWEYHHSPKCLNPHGVMGPPDGDGSRTSVVHTPWDRPGEEDTMRFVAVARNNWQPLIDEIRRLRAERVDWMKISYPVEEWLAGRITIEQMREWVTEAIDNLVECPACTGRSAPGASDDAVSSQNQK